MVENNPNVAYVTCRG